MSRLEQWAAAGHKLVPPVLALLFGGAVVYGFVAKLIGADAFLGVAGLALGYYFRPQPVTPEPRRDG